MDTNGFKLVREKHQALVNKSEEHNEALADIIKHQDSLFSLLTSDRRMIRYQFCSQIYLIRVEVSPKVLVESKHLLLCTYRIDLVNGEEVYTSMDSLPSNSIDEIGNIFHNQAGLNMTDFYKWYEADISNKWLFENVQTAVR